MTDYSALLQSRCLPFLEETEARDLLRVMEMVTVPEGDDLFVADEPADCLYLLVSGRVAVRKGTGFGDRMQVVALLDPGAPVGEGGLLPGQTRGATLTAVADSQLLKLSRQSFAMISSANPGMALKLLSSVMERTLLRLKKSSERLAHIL